MEFSQQKEMGCHSLLQGIFPTQGSNLGLPGCRQMLHHLSHLGTVASGRPIAVLGVIG